MAAQRRRHFFPGLALSPCSILAILPLYFRTASPRSRGPKGLAPPSQFAAVVLGPSFPRPPTNHTSRGLARSDTCS